MSSYSFSHQFYQHWMHAPNLVRAAIVQELMDINTLLQPDTELADFHFSEPDLNTHLEALYDAHYAELAAAQAIADEQKCADKQRLAEEANKKEKEEAALKVAEKEEKGVITNDSTSHDSDSLSPEQHSEPEYKPEPEATTNATPSDDINDPNITKDGYNKAQSNPSKGHVNSNKDKVLSALQQHASANIVKPTPITNTLAKSPLLSKDNEAFIHELSMHIDDYLSEQMAKLSEDLKSWLRAEMSRKLSE